MRRDDAIGEVKLAVREAICPCSGCRIKWALRYFLQWLEGVMVLQMNVVWHKGGR